MRMVSIVGASPKLQYRVSHEGGQGLGVRYRSDFVGGYLRGLWTLSVRFPGFGDATPRAGCHRDGPRSNPVG